MIVHIQDDFRTLDFKIMFIKQKTCDKSIFWMFWRNHIVRKTTEIQSDWVRQNIQKILLPHTFRLSRRPCHKSPRESPKTCGKSIFWMFWPDQQSSRIEENERDREQWVERLGGTQEVRKMTYRNSNKTCPCQKNRSVFLCACVGLNFSSPTLWRDGCE